MPGFYVPVIATHVFNGTLIQTIQQFKTEILNESGGIHVFNDTDTTLLFSVNHAANTDGPPTGGGWTATAGQPSIRDIDIHSAVSAIPTTARAVLLRLRAGAGLIGALANETMVFAFGRANNLALPYDNLPATESLAINRKLASGNTQTVITERHVWVPIDATNDVLRFEVQWTNFTSIITGTGCSCYAIGYA